MSLRGEVPFRFLTARTASEEVTSKVPRLWFWDGVFVIFPAGLNEERQVFVLSQGIPEEIVDEIRQRTDLVSLVGEHLNLEKRGKNMVGLCPFHGEKTPSFTVSPEKQLFHCFGCGASGNVFSFIMKMENFSFPEAVRYLAGKAGVKIPEKESSKNPAGELKEKIFTVNELAACFFSYCLWEARAGGNAVEYLQKRGFNRRVSETFKIGYAPQGWDNLIRYARKKGVGEELLLKAGLVSKREGGGVYDRFRHRIIFPIFNLRGKVMGFGGRSLEESSRSGPKYLNSPETPVFHKGSALYGLHLARDQIRRERSAIVVEGYTDVITAHIAGLKNVVASLGTSLTQSQGRLLRSQAEKVVIAYDADSAGEAATLRGMRILKGLGCMVEVAEMPPGSDPDSMIREGDAASFIDLTRNATPLLDYQLEKSKKGLDITLPQERLQYMKEALAVLSQVRDLIERDIYLKRLSEEIGVSEEALRGEIKKYSHKVAGNNNMALNDQTNNNINNRINPAEKLLVSIIMQGQGFASLVEDEMELDDIENEMVRKVTEEACKLEAAGGIVSPDKIIDHFKEEHVQAFISGAATEPSIQGLSKEMMQRMARDCIKKIKERKLARQRRELQDKLKAMERQGMGEQVRNLLRDQWQAIVKKGSGPYRSGGGEDFHG